MPRTEIVEVDIAGDQREHDGDIDPRFVHRGAMRVPGAGLAGRPADVGVVLRTPLGAEVLRLPDVGVPVDPHARLRSGNGSGPEPRSAERCTPVKWAIVASVEITSAYLLLRSKSEPWWALSVRS